MARWRNWAGSVEARPRHLHAPSSIEELQGIVAGIRDGQRIRMAGSGHSFTPIVPSDDILLLPHDFGDDDSNDIGIDSARMVARIPAGMVLHEVNQRLAAAGCPRSTSG